MDTTTALLKLMAIPTSRFDGVIRTSDGYYLAKSKGDIGYNAFLGKPARPHPGPGRDLMLATWEALSAQERKDVLALAACPMDGLPIPLARDFGVPIE